MNIKTTVNIVFLWLISICATAQILKLEDALQRSMEEYDKIKAKKMVVSATRHNTTNQKQQYLPELTLGAQQNYGTINAQNGPLYAYGGLAAASTSIPLSQQNWNAAFGSLYFANVNWELFTFGKIKSQIDLGTKKELTAKTDLSQEIFQLQVKVSAAYFNLLASQRIKYVEGKNLQRAKVLFEVTAARARSGLIAEVDSLLAKAEVSNARSLEIKSHDKEFEFSKQLAVLLNDEYRTYNLDSVYSTTIPPKYLLNGDVYSHPVLKLQQSRIDEGFQIQESLKAQQRPTLSAFGVVQGRGSGFNWNYIQDNSAYSSKYLNGVGIDRSNYLLGLSLNWNITEIFRFSSKVKEQKFLTKSLQNDFDLYKKELDAQSKLAISVIQNAFENFEETKIQLSAAELAYRQNIALYKSGLTNLVDFTQALYSLHRAEIDHELAQNNVWQALLLLASAQGDIQILFQKSVTK